MYLNHRSVGVPLQLFRAAVSNLPMNKFAPSWCHGSAHGDALQLLKGLSCKLESVAGQDYLQHFPQHGFEVMVVAHWRVC